MPDQLTDYRIQSNVDLTDLNTLGVHAHAHWYSRIASQNELQALCQSEFEVPIFILGGGSNILFRNDFNGMIIHIDIQGKEVVQESEDHVWLKAGAGENWHQTVLYCIEKGWGGIENLSLIPGTVGAAPIQNIGAYGVELEEVFEELEAIELESGKRQVFKKEDCCFGYRDSIFKNELKGTHAVCSVTLRLDKKHKLNTSYGAIKDKLKEKNIEQPTIKDISDVVIEIRKSKLPDPRELGNAGSFFKNPAISKRKFQNLKENYTEMPGYPLDNGKIKVPAGWLIDEAGWKGKVIGNAGTYDQQALVIVNHGGATGSEIWQLAKQIQQSVKEQFDISLVPEVNIVE